MRLIFSLLCLFAVSGHLVHADDKLSVGGKLWVQESVNVTKGSSAKDGFKVYRGQIISKYAFDESWSALANVDATNDGVKLYQLYMNKKGLLMDKDNFRFGLQPTFFVENNDGVMKTRWIAKSAMDEMGLSPSNASGARWTTELMSGFTFGLMFRNNSEVLSQNTGVTGNVNLNWAFMDSDSGKFGVQVDGGMKSSDYIYVDGKTMDGTSPAQNNVMASIYGGMSFVDFALEYGQFMPKGGTNYSAYGVNANIKLGDSFGLFGRYFAGTSSALKGGYTVGPSYACLKGKVNSGLFYENKTTSTGNEAQAVLRMAASF